MSKRKDLLYEQRNDTGLIERFKSKLFKTDSGCWEMRTHVDKDGYPLIWFADNNMRGAQVSYVIFHKKPLTGIICHTCDNPACVNPAHLFMATSKINTRDMLSKKRGGAQKITETQVIELYEHSCKGTSNKQLAEIFGISASTVCNILKGRNWEWLYDRYLAIQARYKGCQD